MQRLLLPMLVPLGALAATALIIGSIGLLLLWSGDYSWAERHGGRATWDLGLFAVARPVIVALLVALVVLAGATLASRWGRDGG